MVAFPLLCLIPRGYPPVKTNMAMEIDRDMADSAMASLLGWFVRSAHVSLDFGHQWSLSPSILWLQSCTSLVSYLRASWWQSKPTLTKVSGGLEQLSDCVSSAAILRMNRNCPCSHELRILHGTSWNHKTKGYGRSFDHLISLDVICRLHKCEGHPPRRPCLCSA
jgi:hypothetical protein